MQEQYKKYVDFSKHFVATSPPRPNFFWNQSLKVSIPPLNYNALLLNTAHAWIGQQNHAQAILPKQSLQMKTCSDCDETMQAWHMVNIKDCEQES